VEGVRIGYMIGKKGDRKEKKEVKGKEIAKYLLPNFC
jgi:hypothetical protein